MNIELKRATLKDLDEVINIETSGTSQTYAGLIKPGEARDAIINNFVFLIRHNNITIGSISYKINNKDSVRLDTFVVYLNYRGKGFGKAAIALLLKKTNKFKKVDLTVHPHNSRAISLYLSVGFMIESWQDNYYGDGEPRMILVKHKKK